MLQFKLLLASASPRRADILKAAGIPFEIVGSSFEEPAPDDADNQEPSQFVTRLARAKAQYAQLPARNADDKLLLVLAADTIVWHCGQILGKPLDAAAAIATLRRLRGQAHEVYTGVCLRVVHPTDATNDDYHEATATTTVRFRDVADGWISRYVATGEPLDKAGAYAAQGRGAALVESIAGDFWNVVGLPLATLTPLLETVGSPIESWWE